MALLNLKSIIGRKKEIIDLLQSISDCMNAVIIIEDEKGNIIWGQEVRSPAFMQALRVEDEIIGWVKGSEQARPLASFLCYVVQKEWEKKKLGTEVLNLYQEVNLIFDFSEKLSRTIDTVSICSITIDEARRVIQSDAGIILLWNQSGNLEQRAFSGSNLFNDERTDSYAFLSEIAKSGQSEMITDTVSLVGAGSISYKVGSMIYSSLKVGNRILGAIVLASSEPVQYVAGDLKLLTTLALQSASAIESAMQYEKNIREAREKEESMRKVYEVTAKFVPREFLASLGHHVITDIRLGDHVEKIVTVLFADIREFTGMSEKMSPQENFNFVCSFNECMGPIIRKQKGFINQYIGDAIMAIFPGNARDALTAAIEMQLALEGMNRVRKEQGKQMIRIGIGMHTGPLIMGITGDEQRLDATTISDTVNTASRLESLTKYYKAGIIISDSGVQQIAQTHQFHLRPLGLVQLKGKEEALRIHECFDGNSDEDVYFKLKTLSRFSEAMHHYTNQSYVNAGKAFEEVLDLYPNDRTARFFHEKTRELILSARPDLNIGLVEMPEK